MTWKIWQGDCRDAMAFNIADESVHCCITSPPYFGLRDYGVDGQIGLEPTPVEYVEQMVQVFREVRRVLREDGTLWLNLGDTYGKDKSLLGIPWRIAFALQADGWRLRQDIIWHKPNPMPESVRDRCTKAHEYLFLLSKSPRYYWDAEAMQEPANLTGKGNANGFRGGAYVNNSTFNNAEGGRRTAVGNVGARSKRDTFKREASKRAEVFPGQSVGTHRPDRENSAYSLETRNRRSVWTVATRPYKGAHFATFPPALIEPCVCAGAPVGGLVLDPFAGSGTAGAVALAQGRRFVGCELNPEYIKLAEERISAIELWR